MANQAPVARSSRYNSRHPSRLPTTRSQRVSQKKNQHENDSPNGMKYVSPTIAGLYDIHRKPMAFHGFSVRYASRRMPYGT